MNKKQEKEKIASSKDHGQQSIDSVHDFLYADHQRISIFRAQFENYGDPKETTHKTSEQSQSQSKVGGRIGPRPLQLNPEKATQRQSGEELSTVYDPLWINALAFLDLLDERGLLQRDARKAKIGQLVLASGSLEVMDLSLIKNHWNNQTVRENIIKNTMGNMTKEQLEDMSVAMEMVQDFPHTIQATLAAGNVRIWSTLKPEALVTSSGDLLLKHGLSIGGTWNIVGILDAHAQSEANYNPFRIYSLDNLRPDSAFFVRLLTSLTPMVRQFLGRPLPHYGVTPLLIFREVGGRVT